MFTFQLCAVTVEDKQPCDLNVMTFALFRKITVKLNDTFAKSKSHAR